MQVCKRETAPRESDGMNRQRYPAAFLAGAPLKYCGIQYPRCSDAHFKS
jgi:hypothetical protein